MTTEETNCARCHRPESAAITAALDAAWQDLHEWRRLAEEQRRAHPDPNHAPQMPSEAGIAKTRWILDALMPPAFLALETMADRDRPTGGTPPPLRESEDPCGP